MREYNQIATRHPANMHGVPSSDLEMIAFLNDYNQTAQGMNQQLGGRSPGAVGIPEERGFLGKVLDYGISPAHAPTIGQGGVGELPSVESQYRATDAPEWADGLGLYSGDQLIKFKGSPLDVTGTHYGQRQSGKIIPGQVRESRQPDLGFLTPTEEPDIMSLMQDPSTAGGELESSLMDTTSPHGPSRGGYSEGMKQALATKKKGEEKPEEESDWDFNPTFEGTMEAFSPMAQVASKYPKTAAQIMANQNAMDFSPQAKEAFGLASKQKKTRAEIQHKRQKLLAEARQARLDRKNKMDIAKLREDSRWEISEAKNDLNYEKMQLKNEQKFAGFQNQLDKIAATGEWKGKNIDRRSLRKREEMTDQYEYDKSMQDSKMIGSLKELGVSHGYSMTALKAKNAHDFKKAVIQSDDKRYNTDKVYQGRVDTLANNRFLQKISQKHDLKKLDQTHVYDMDKMDRSQMFAKELLKKRQDYNLETLEAKNIYTIKEMELDSKLIDWRSKNRFAETLRKQDNAYRISSLLQQDRHRHAVRQQGRLFKNQADLQNAQFGQQDKILDKRQGHAQALLASKWGFQMKHLAESNRLTSKQQMEHLAKKMELDYAMQDKKAAYEKSLQIMKNGHAMSIEKIRNKYKETSGEKALNRDYAKAFVKWQTNDKGLVAKNIEKLKRVEQWISESMKNKGASISGYWVGKGGESFRNLVHKRSVEAERLVRQVTQLDLKKILGGQFAEKEGERMLNTTFDKSANEADNLYRIRMLRHMMENRSKELDSQQAHFRKHKTMVNYFGGSSTPSNISDLPLTKDLTRENLLEIKRQYDEQGIR